MKKFSFATQLFISVAVLFLLFAVSFVFFQYTREREYREELMTMRLQDFNNEFCLVTKNDNSGVLTNERSAVLDSLITAYASTHGLDSLRVTLILDDGKVIYDNWEKNVARMSNHRNRAEVQLALKYGKGSSINRLSQTVTTNFFYSATYYKNNHLIIRSAMPYDVTLSDALKIDPIFIYFAIVLSILLGVIFSRYINRMGNYIAQLRMFVQKADNNEPLEPDMISAFPDNDLGKISKHIVQMYNDLSQTKEALSIEREKLITHLRISKEGLGIFDKDNRCTLANPLFTQYSNLIADKPLAHNKDVLELKEFNPIIDFLNNSDPTIENEPEYDFEIDKDGRIFEVKCVIFPDSSYELSINDVTKRVEQSRLKHQLTQNIAHELKTPICSIQGFLETILTNKTLSDENKNQFLERCFAQSNRLANLLRDITVLTRMDEAKQNVDKDMVDINKIVDTIQHDVALQLNEQQMQVNIQLPEKLIVNGNESLVYSIFRNLFDNAIAYAGVGTTITLNCFRQDDSFVYFSFADSGVGVDSQHLNRLFERFYRVDKGRSRKMGGTGLGLAIVKNAVRFHGGNISAKNVPTGGLEFVFSLHK